jgi:hypothetical protein
MVFMVHAIERQLGDKLRRACDPFHGSRFKTFVGKIKNLPQNILDLAIEKGVIHESDSPDSEVKLMITHTAF